MISDWRPVPGFEGYYEVSVMGQVRRIRRRGDAVHGSMRLQHPKYLTPCRQHSGAKVILSRPGKRRIFSLTHLMWETFRGSVPDGMTVIPMDGDRYNLELDNLTLVGRRALGRKTGGRSTHKPVVKLSAYGEILDVYRSGKEAAEANFMSAPAMYVRCRGEKKLPDPDGCIYRYDD